MRKLNWDGIVAFVDEQKDKSIEDVASVISGLAAEQRTTRKASKRREDVRARAELQRTVQEQKFKLRALHAIYEVKKMYGRIERKGTPSGAIPFRTGFHGKCDTTAGTTLSQFINSVGRAVNISSDPRNMPKFGPAGATATDYAIQLCVGPNKEVIPTHATFCGMHYIGVSNGSHEFYTTDNGVFMLADEDSVETACVPAALAWEMLHYAQPNGVSKRVIGTVDNTSGTPTVGV